MELAILIIIGALSLKYFNNKDKILLLADSIFKFSIGLFLIIYFLNNNVKDVNNRVIFIVSGFIFILLIDYIQLCKTIFGNDKC